MTKAEIYFENDPPDYSISGESTLSTLIIRGEPLNL